MRADRVTRGHLGGRMSLRRDLGLDNVDVIEGRLLSVAHGRTVTRLTVEAFGEAVTIDVAPDDELEVRNADGDRFA